MSSNICVNGRNVALSHDLDASSSNYIILRTEGSPLNKRQKTMLQDLGVVIHEFIGDETQQVYLCGFKDKSLEQVSKLDFVNYVGVYANDFAMPKAMQADAQAGAITVDILLQQDVTVLSDELIRKLAKAAQVDSSAIILADGGVQIRIAADRLAEIAQLDEVRVVHTANETSLFTNVARRIMRINDDAMARSAPYTGKGQVVCVADTGFDAGSDQDVHEAFAGRVKQLFPWGRAQKNLADDLDGHGTHVCGAVLGKGQHCSQGLMEGTAPGAELIMQSLFSGFDALDQPRLGGIPKVNLQPLFDQAYQAGARVHTNSWGSGLPITKVQRPYDGRSESIDLFVWEHQDMTVLFAAGNDGQDVDLDGKLDGRVNVRSLGAEASAKNCITVGATENMRPDLCSGDLNRPYTYGGFWSKRFAENPLRDDHMANNAAGLAAFSSRGPTAENRLKPDVVAPGTAILSTRTRKKKFLTKVNQGGESGDDKYMYLSGTSMATPLVAGCCAILREALLEDGYRDEQDGIKNPTGSLIKALLINGAVPIGGQYMPGDVSSEPNPHSGFGRVDMTGSMPRHNDSYAGYGIGVADEDNEGPFLLQIDVPAAEQRSDRVSNDGCTFKLTLVYADLPGGQLQNDLNLVVAVGDRERHGNQIKRYFPLNSKEAFDRRNNVEQVVWPSLSSAPVRVMVKPFRYMSNRVPFAYAWKFF